MIIRDDHKDNFFCLNNEVAHDSRLSIAARGLLVLMLANSDEWNFSRYGLSKTLGIDVKTLDKLTKELKECGYLEQKRTKDGTLIVGCEWIVHERPTLPINNTIDSEHYHNSTVLEFHSVEVPQCGKTVAIINTKYNKYQNITNTNNNNKRNASHESVLTMISTYAGDNLELKQNLIDWLEVRKKKRLAETESSIRKNLDSLSHLASASGMSETEYTSEIVKRSWGAFYEIKNYSAPSAVKAQDNIYDELRKKFAGK